MRTPLNHQPEAQHGPFCGTGRQRFKFARNLHFPNDLARVIHNADARVLDRYVRAEEPSLPLQANWIGSRAAVAMAIQRCRRAELPVVCVETRHIQAV